MDAVSTPPTHQSTNPEHQARARLEALLAQAWARLNLSPLEAAPMARDAEHLARRTGDNRSWAQSLLIWGIASLYDGQPHEAILHLCRALAVYRFLGDEEGQWYCLSTIALAWSYLGEPTQAAETRALATGLPYGEVFEASAFWLRWFKPL